MIKTALNQTPREFKVGDFQVKDHGSITLSADAPKTNEMITLVSKSGKRCDISATSWGFYLGPSLNSRLLNEGFKAVLVHNSQGQLYLMAVENDQMEAFNSYIKESALTIVQWLDSWQR